MMSLNIRRIFRWGLFVGVLLGFTALTIFFIWYARYLYHLPKNISDEILSYVGFEDRDYERAIIQGRKFIRKLVVDWSLPSISVSVGKNGKILWYEAFGYADPDRKIPARADIPYRIHSVSKPMTAMAAAKSWERGVLDLDRSVREYLPEFPEKKYEISIRHLLCHQSGIRHYNSDEEIFNKTYYQDVLQSLAMFDRDTLLYNGELPPVYKMPMMAEEGFLKNLEQWINALPSSPSRSRFGGVRTAGRN